MDSEKAPLEVSDEWEEFRSLSLAPGGFKEKRADIWSKVLHAVPQQFKETLTDGDSSSHPDERQIRLDTERSFVLYPVESETDKDKLQSELNDLLVEIFRKRPKLNYFQGYHDIITVLLLTLPQELQMPCAEQLSLQRVRDSMGSTLEPVLGLLRVMKNLLRVADPQYAELLERTSPLPYYALPNLLTLFSHDMPTLSLIQHVFDYLLCRPPIYVVYLAAVIILSRKQEVERLEQEGEEGMMHSILSALPEIIDDESIAEEPQPKDGDNFFPELKEESLPEEVSDVTQDPSDLLVASDALSQTQSSETAGEPHADLPAEQEASDDLDLPLAESVAEIQTDLLSSPPPEVPTDDSDCAPTSSRRPWKPKPHTMTDILNMSDALYKSHPPADPSLQLSSIMGPQSVVFIWSTDASDMPSDDEAERMVERLDLVVYPELSTVEPKERDTKIPRPKRFKRRAGSGTVGLLVGAGLVLGVAVAISVYGARQGGDPTRNWRKLGRWAGGVVAAASERVIRYGA
ncbi:rab-GTPase-TBC domain-containing protein [Mycena albidolilacea]|uniref:Rab-GTPase-TBC domain-containing protein n=1 Tax=Mycena albidolilacea TaxID=1033008 RepID=A0AAD7EWM8_9AGAR|nr:rab-GTPase-TBC domain-containing protein [Mycena albidolilacea]